MERSGISPTSIEVIHADAEYIVDVGILGSGTSNAQGTGSRERSGLVMGAVQSGKTASMLAVVAKAIDRGVDAVIVLAGTQRTLWQQTLARLVSQLDARTPGWDYRRLVPQALDPQSPPGVDDLYKIRAQEVQRAFRMRIPIIAVVMKNVAHLERMAATLHEQIFPAAATRQGPFQLLVIDDEADDSSILDAVGEHQAGVSFAETKQVPRRIADLWESRSVAGQTSHNNLFAT